VIDTHEYCHNFMGIDGHVIGPEYRLRFPYPVQLEHLSGAFRALAPPLLRKLLPGFVLDKLISRIALQGMKAVQVEGNEITFRGKPEASFYCRLLGFVTESGSAMGACFTYRMGWG
jgi:hypothetical protein